MKVLKYSLGQLKANCYFLIEDNNCLIIDPGDEANFILEELQRRKLKLVGMLATHGHFDHIMAVGEVQRSFNVSFYISKKDFFLINRVKETAEYFLGYQPVFFKPNNINFFNKKTFHVSSFTFHVIETPGHTPGSCCFYFWNENIIFTGDTLFKGDVGKYDFSYSNKKDLKNSLKKIFTLPEKIVVYPGHGEETTIKNEKNNLMF